MDEVSSDAYSISSRRSRVARVKKVRSFNDI